MKKIQPTKWNTWKTEAIDFNKDFRWLDDLIFPEENRILKENNADNKLILIESNVDWKTIEKIINDNLKT